MQEHENLNIAGDLDIEIEEWNKINSDEREIVYSTVSSSCGSFLTLICC